MYGTIILNNTIGNSISLLGKYKDSLDPSGNIFVLVRNEVDAIGDVTSDFLDVIDAASSMGYLYVNTIVVPTEDKINADLPDNVLYIVWLAKDKNHFFNKDVIRESHIWKDVEWGKRAKNYNPKGKDPGNVWIPTEDDGKAQITEHILLNMSDIINRLHNCSSQIGLDTLYITSSRVDNLSINKDIIVTQLPHSAGVTSISSYILRKPLKKAPASVQGTVVWGTSEKMNKVANESVNVVVTSPPYWDLKDYFKDGQIGQ